MAEEGAKGNTTQLDKVKSKADPLVDGIKYRTWDGKLVDHVHDKEYMELTLRSGKHSEAMKKMMRQRIEARAREFPRWPAEPNAGARHMWIESRFWYDRERLGPDFDEDWRAYRAKYLCSLELDPREPVHNPEYERALINPIRRFYMKGGDLIENFLLKTGLSKDKYHSSIHRVTITRAFMGWVGMVGLYYYIRYHNRTWEQDMGVRIIATRPVLFPGDPDYPYQDRRTEPTHHFDSNFSRRKLFRDLRDYEDRSVAL